MSHCVGRNNYLLVIALVLILQCAVTYSLQHPRITTPTLQWREDIPNSHKMGGDRTIEFYVATSGSDSNPGTSEKPFFTAFRAQQAVRTVLSTNSSPVTVFFKKGTYYFNETLTFRPEDSGNPSGIVTYTAQSGNEVVLSGGMPIQCTWSKTTFNPKVYWCQLPKNNPVGELLSLFVNGERYWPARFPNYDPKDPTVNGNGYVNAVKGFGGSSDKNPPFPGVPATGMTFDPKTFSPRVGSWKNPELAIVNVFAATYWGNLMYKIAFLDCVNSTITFGAGGGQLNTYKFKFGANVGSNSRFYVENVFEELDVPGEFYLDTEFNILYLYPLSGVDITKADIVAPLLKKLVAFQGESHPVNTYNESIYVQYIVLKNFTFTHTAPTFLDTYQVPSGGDWTIHRGGTVWFETARNCSVENSLFDQVGGNGVFVNGAAQGIGVLNSEFSYPGDSGVCVVGVQQETIGSALVFPRGTTIVNNYFHNIGFYGKQTAGVFNAVAEGTIISNNLIHDVPRAGILINDGFCGGHIIEYNTIYNCVLETSDHGPFNSWGRERYWAFLMNHPIAGSPASYPAGPVTDDVLHTITVRNNLFIYYGQASPSLASWAVDMDDGSSNYHVYENVCVGSAIKIGATGDLHTVENNVIVDPIFPVLFWVPMYNNQDVFLNNIVYHSQSIGTFSICYVLGALNPKSSDQNLYYSSPSDVYDFIKDGSHGSWADWQSMGFDVHSLIAKDPQFFDAKNGNFTVKDTSPALQLGFKNFPYGVQKENKAWKHATKTPSKGFVFEKVGM